MRAPDLAADLAYGLDPVAFAIDRLGFTPDAWQADLMRSTASQQAENCSRQSGKSTTAGAIAVHCSVYEPRSLILLVSPSLRQSRELFAKVMEFLRRLQPAEALEEDNKSSATLGNGSRIVSLPGDARTVRGFSAPSLVIEDEAGFVSDDLYTAIRPMLAVSRGRLILMSTPNGRRGHFYETWANGGDSWERYEVPASACPRISKEFLDQERAALGPMLFSQEYECQFVDADSSAFSSLLIEQALRDDFAAFV
jgi:hypothetical protein